MSRIDAQSTIPIGRLRRLRGLTHPISSCDRYEPALGLRRAVALSINRTENQRSFQRRTS